MADRARKSTTGGGNFTIIAPISSNAVGTSNTFIFDMNVTSAVSNALVFGKAGNKVTLTSKMNSSELTTFLKTYGKTEVQEVTKEYFEDGEVFTSGTADVANLFFCTVGGTAGGLRQIWYGTCIVSASGDLTLQNNTVSERPIEMTTMAWNGSAVLTIPAGFWALLTKKDGTTKFLKTTSPTIALPTEMALDVASVEAWQEPA